MKASPRRNAAPSKLLMVINLKRRSDRLARMRAVLDGVDWKRIDAVDGKKLTWKKAERFLHKGALADAKWAEEHGVPTICTRTGSFSPHFTLSAVGCALSHRKAWEQLARSKHDWALIMEDDVSCVVDRLDETLDRVVAQLPSGWQLCFVGYHESTGELLSPEKRVRMAELGVDEGQTGLFAYMLKRSAAVELLADRDVFPLRHQIDVAVRSQRRPCMPSPHCRSLVRSQWQHLPPRLPTARLASLATHVSVRAESECRVDA
jgi:hypothetical protein